MRIGFYGGLANNMYLFAKAALACGHEPLFVRDRTDCYPFSQPVWEDCRFSMALERAPQDADAWDAFEADLGWVPPTWLADPRTDQSGSIVPSSSRPRSFVERLMGPTLRSNPRWAPLVARLQECDLLIVCGVEGAQLAFLSGRPYLIWPHGGDIRLAADYPRNTFRHPVAHLRESCRRARIRMSFEAANWIGTHDPTGVGGPFCNIEKVLRGKPLHRVPIPLPNRPQLSRAERRQLREALFAEFNIPLDPEKPTAFIPSRVDFHWKGHDRLLSALPSIADFQFLFAGWGGDRLTAMEMAAQYECQSRICFLPFTLSKPLMFEFFAASDLVIDQFIFGTYGTAAVEAMAGGTPVMMHIDGQAFAARGWIAPPVLNCRNREDIEATFAHIRQGKIDLVDAGNKAREWCAAVHSPQSVFETIASLARVNQ